MLVRLRSYVFVLIDTRRATTVASNGFGLFTARTVNNPIKHNQFRYLRKIKSKPRRPLKAFVLQEMWNPFAALQRPHGIRALVIDVTSATPKGLLQRHKFSFCVCGFLFFLEQYGGPTSSRHHVMFCQRNNVTAKFP